MTRNFIELIDEYNIIIPLIQRDYVQGREKEKNKANNFLNAIKNNLDSGLNLDFIYGKTDDKKFIPLDGQQRLTTLFLLHWYASLENDYSPYLTKFSYEVRSSTKDFIEKLTEEKNWGKFKKDKIKESIENSNWFFLSWKNDPTVVSLLNMLNVIENKFKDISIDKFNKITFEFLDLDKFNLTDELYVKMNARGKPLSDFENFKAEFEKYITDEKIKSNFDNKWMDIFWKIAQTSVENSKENISKAPKLADKMFFNFLYNITFNFYLEDLESLKCKINDEDKDYTTIKAFIDECSIFDFYKNVYDDEENIGRIISILDNLKSDKIFKKFIAKKDISQLERIQFYALSLGYIKDLDDKEFNRWKRVSLNLINNRLIQSPKDIIEAITELKRLSNECGNDIYSYVNNNSDNIKYFTKIQREEESLKAYLIENESNNWEKELVIAESHWYLNGQISFLLKFSDNNLNSFIKYRDKFINLFDKDRLYKEKSDNTNYQTLIHRALMTFGDYLIQHAKSKKYTFCVYDNGLRIKNENWREVFNGESSKLFKDLLDILTVNIEEDLKKQINNYKFDNSDWKSYFINPNNDWEIISFAKNYQIKIKNKKIYLNRGYGNNPEATKWGWVRVGELYSYYLYKDIEYKETIIVPFQKKFYWESSEPSKDPSCIVFHDFQFNHQIIELHIGHKNSNFYLEAYIEDENFRAIIINKLKSIGFNKNIKADIGYNDILKEIEDTCKELKSLQ